ncbi:hypothetical protein N7488_000995 [Penicillium malachiteum]|nr:hypothetical protein N7488_000995 [Penicillium malachiteum]
MQSAENLYIRGNQSLRYVIDGYNDPWLKTEPICGPRPQPDHARGLKRSAFTETYRHKLSAKADKKSTYMVPGDMYFPYLTAEIKSGNRVLEIADRQNMHSMCIAVRAVVSLCQAAGCMEEVHRRILGFSISHGPERCHIYGHCPEIDGGKASYYRWPIAEFNIWTAEDRWTCYRFVENIDREFQPIHTNRLMSILEGVPDPDDDAFEIDVEKADLQQSIVGSQDRGLQQDLQMLVQTLQQQLVEQKEQLTEQKEREEKREAEHKQQLADQRAREERLLAQLERLLAS